VKGDVEIVGVTYRQLDWWVSKGYLRPLNPSPGQGVAREFPEDEIQVARTMGRLVAAGIPPHIAVKVARGNAEIAPGVRVVVEELAEVSS